MTAKDIPADVMERAMELAEAGNGFVSERANAIALAPLTERREAEQRGAERMREAAAKIVEGEGKPETVAIAGFRFFTAAAIRALPTTAETGKEA